MALWVSLNFSCSSYSRIFLILFNYNYFKFSSFCLGITVLFYLTRYMSASITNFNTNLSANDRLFNFDDESTVLEPINGTRDYRLISRKHQFDRPWFDNQDCVRFAACEKLQNNTCFGSKLPYTYTSLALTDSYSQADSQEKLYNYEALRNIPKCWTVIQVRPLYSKLERTSNVLPFF